MTTTTPAATQPPWKVRWALYTATALAILLVPDATRAVGLQLIRNAAEIAGIDGQDPVVISPTNPPVVNP